MHPGQTVLKQLNHRPLVVASLDGHCDLLVCAKKALQEGADLIEVRVDTLHSRERRDLPAILASIRDVCPLPVIATVRSPIEQGSRSGTYKLDDEERKRIFEAVLPQVDLIDIELSSTSINEALVKLAHREKKKVILSYHDFNSVPSESRIEKLVKQFHDLPGDILKIAATPRTPEEVGKLMTACLSLNHITRVFIAMGEMGMISRVAGFSFGSCLTYGFVSKTIAPGQLSVQDLVRQCRFFYPS